MSKLNILEMLRFLSVMKIILVSTAFIIDGFGNEYTIGNYIITNGKPHGYLNNAATPYTRVEK